MVSNQVEGKGKASFNPAAGSVGRDCVRILLVPPAACTREALEAPKYRKCYFVLANMVLALLAAH
jgi:hypothetical protein